MDSSCRVCALHLLVSVLHPSVSFRDMRTDTCRAEERDLRWRQVFFRVRPLNAKFYHPCFWNTSREEAACGSTSACHSQSLHFTALARANVCGWVCSVGSTVHSFSGYNEKEEKGWNGSHTTQLILVLCYILTGNNYYNLKAPLSLFLY